MIDSMEQLIRHQGWARGAKLMYLIQKHLIDGKSKEEIIKDAVDKHNIFHHRSFTATWNQFMKIKDDISYHEK